MHIKLLLINQVATCSERPLRGTAQARSISCCGDRPAPLSWLWGVPSMGVLGLTGVFTLVFIA